MNFVTKVTYWDERMVTDLALHRNGQLTRFMALITRIGDGWGWLAAALCVAILDFANAVAILSQFAGALILEIGAYTLLKRWFSRQRPFRKCDGVSCVVIPRDEFSFPSGHTATAFVAVTILSSFYSWMLAPLVVLAVLIGISRVYLGVHYPSDVMAGTVLGTVCAKLILLLF